jgi:hypothetical protein
MFTQKLLESLLLYYSLTHEDKISAVVFQLLNQLAERLDRIEVLLENRQSLEVKQLKNVREAMLSKVERQLKHLEQTHNSTITDLTAEVKAMKQTLENTKSKFIGFE